MPEHRLPDDVERWPRNPFALLGVSEGVTQQELRRAYAKLIRTYKPEHFPKQFALIRAAFEELRDRLDWGATLDQFITTRPAAPDPEASKSPPTTAQPQSRDDDRLAELPLRQEVEFAWNEAADANPERTYELLSRLAAGQAAADTTFIRLYWLLSLYPALDRERQPLDWLVTAMRSGYRAGPVWSLYCSELERHPQRVAGAGHRMLIAATTDPDQLLALLEVQWRAASQSAQWCLLQEDLQVISTWLSDAEPLIRVKVLLLASGFAAWSKDRIASEVFQACESRLLEQFDSNFELTEAFARYDLLATMRGDILADQTSSLTTELLQVLCRAWFEPLDDLRPSLQRLLAKWAAQPYQTLTMLTQLREHSKTLFSYLRAAILRVDRGRNTRGSPERSVMIGIAVRRFFQSNHDGAEFSELRTALLTFCITYGIDLHEILVYFGAWLKEKSLESVYGELLQDQPLDVVISGVFAFWA